MMNRQPEHETSVSAHAGDDGDSKNTSSPLITELGPNDILLGRGTGPNVHIGNIRYRTLLREVLTTSSGVNLQDRNAKWILANHVMAIVKKRNGRFLQKQKQKNPSEGEDNGKVYYVEVPDRVALEKTKHSFRFQLKGEHQASSSGKAAAAHKMAKPSSQSKQAITMQVSNRAMAAASALQEGLKQAPMTPGRMLDLALLRNQPTTGSRSSFPTQEGLSRLPKELFSMAHSRSNVSRQSLFQNSHPMSTSTSTTSTTTPPDMFSLAATRQALFPTRTTPQATTSGTGTSSSSYLYHLLQQGSHGTSLTSPSEELAATAAAMMRREQQEQAVAVLRNQEEQATLSLRMTLKLEQLDREKQALLQQQEALLGSPRTGETGAFRALAAVDQLHREEELLRQALLVSSSSPSSGGETRTASNIATTSLGEPTTGRTSNDMYSNQPGTSLLSSLLAQRELLTAAAELGASAAPGAPPPPPTLASNSRRRRLIEEILCKL